jgi:nucleotide-binding universal stress UspA family protein
MSDEFKPISEILVPMDFSSHSMGALEYAKRIAAPIGARLHLLYVDDEPMLIAATTDQSFRDQHREIMAKKFVGLMPQSQLEQFRVVELIRFGTAYFEIEKYAAEEQIDLIVMGYVTRSTISKVLLGSVASHLIRHSPCPVVAVRQAASV